MRTLRPWAVGEVLEPLNAEWSGVERGAFEVELVWAPTRLWRVTGFQSEGAPREALITSIRIAGIERMQVGAISVFHTRRLKLPALDPCERLVVRLRDFHGRIRPLGVQFVR